MQRGRLRTRAGPWLGGVLEAALDQILEIGIVIPPEYVHGRQVECQVSLSLVVKIGAPLLPEISGLKDMKTIDFLFDRPNTSERPTIAEHWGLAGFIRIFDEK